MKEMTHIAVSAANARGSCVHRHTVSARAKGMSNAMYGGLLAVIGMATQTNAPSTARQVPVDERFRA